MNGEPVRNGASENSRMAARIWTVGRFEFDPRVSSGSLRSVVAVCLETSSCWCPCAMFALLRHSHRDEVGLMNCYEVSHGGMSSPLEPKEE